MNKHREIDVMMAEKVLGGTVYFEKSGAERERAANGQSRPLRSYSTDISAAWEVVQKLGMTLIPIDTGWFALVGSKRGFASPADFITYLQTADFVNAGAAVGPEAPMTICLAAIRALSQKEAKAAEPGLHVAPPPEQNYTESH